MRYRPSSKRPGGYWQLSKTPMIDLKPHHLEEVQQILAEHVPDCEVRVLRLDERSGPPVSIPISTLPSLVTNPWIGEFSAGSRMPSRSPISPSRSTYSTGTPRPRAFREEDRFGLHGRVEERRARPEGIGLAAEAGSGQAVAVLDRTPVLIADSRLTEAAVHKAQGVSGPVNQNSHCCSRSGKA